MVHRWSMLRHVSRYAPVPVTLVYDPVGVMIISQEHPIGHCLGDLMLVEVPMLDERALLSVAPRLL